MRRLTTLIVVVACLFLTWGNDVIRAQATPAFRYQFRTEGIPLSGAFDVVHQILLFPPGSTTPWHTHPGLVLVTVIEGEQTFRVDGTERVYKAGDSFTEMPGHIAQAHNASAAQTLLLVSYVLPDGAPLSVPQPDDTTPLPRPVAGYQFRTDGLVDPGAYDVAHVILDFAPGAATPWHTHPGEVLVTVLEGMLKFSVNGVEKVYQAGESFVELPGEVAQASNTTGARTSVMATYLLPAGASLSHPVNAPGAAPAPIPPAPPALPPALPPAGEEAPQPVELPNTGADHSRVPMLVVAMVMLAGGIALKRRRTSGT